MPGVEGQGRRLARDTRGTNGEASPSGTCHNGAPVVPVERVGKPVGQGEDDLLGRRRRRPRLAACEAPGWWSGPSGSGRGARSAGRRVVSTVTALRISSLAAVIRAIRSLS